jgi:hypothetical protein
MTIVINYTNKSGACPETLVDVKSYKETSLWSKRQAAEGM